MKKVKIFKGEYWDVEIIQDNIDHWTENNEINIISATSTMYGDCFVTTIIYEEKSEGFSLNS